MLVGVTVALALATLVGLAFRVALRPDARVRVAGVIVGAAVLAPLPLLVPLDERGSALVRWLVAIHVAVVGAKLWDLHRGFGVHGRPSLLDHLRFVAVTTPFHLVFRQLDSEPGPGRLESARLLLVAALEMVAGAVAFVVVYRADFGHHGFLADHAAKCLAIYPLLDGFFGVQVAVFRLVGLRARDVWRDPIVARTPAELWRLYNRPVGQYLQENVWKPCGGRRAPVRAILATFLVSGLVHEYLFAIALERVTGYQVAFFLLQGVAVVATARARPVGWKAPFAVLATHAFLIVTLVLFAASVAALVGDLLTIHPHGRPL